MAQSSREVRRFETTSQKSRALNDEAAKYMPGGNTRTVLHYDPYPAFIARGQGSRIYDVDGNERIDFNNNQTSLLLGHAHPAVVEAATEQLAKGMVFSGPTESQIKLSRMICDRVPSVDHVRFANSGTEATMNAIRAARAFSGKEKVAKFEGAYHGTHDAASISVAPPLDAVGDPERPTGYLQTQTTLGGAGIPKRVLDEIVVLPFNDFASTERIVRENADELAAVMIDPVMAGSGYPRPKDDFLERLRDLTSELDILLIFDEVISLRVASGGAQELYDIQPDITAMGKFIGGGLPVGAFGGHRDIMALFDPTQWPPEVAQSGTFNANPMTMVSGAAALEQLTPEVYARLTYLGDTLREKLQTLFAELSFPAQVTGIASLFKIHITQNEIFSYRDAATSNKELERQMFMGLLNEGIQIDRSCAGNLSTPMGVEELDAFVEAVGRVIPRLT